MSVLLAGPGKCKWPSVTLWSVFQNPVTYDKGYSFYMTAAVIIGGGQGLRIEAP